MRLQFPKPTMTSCFSSKFSCSDDHVPLDAPDVHIVPYITGGLMRLLEGIKGHSIPKLHEYGHHTNAAGQFHPRASCLMGLRYTVRKVLDGKGQSAVLVFAEDEFDNNRPVVIKVLHTEFYHLGAQESHILRKLAVADPYNHSHTLRLLNTLTFDSHYCMVFEPLLPDPLSRVFQELPPRMVLANLRRVALRLLASVGFLHQQNMIHADLKPENILLKHEGDLDSVHIVDFGNAVHYVHREVSLYYKDFELQTPLYRAPEVMFGLPFGTEIDLWSLGCILAELYTGHALFLGSTKDEIMQQMSALLGPLPVKTFQRGKFFKGLKKYTGDKPQFQATTILMDHLQCTDIMFADLVAGLLRYNPDERLTAAEAGRHPFFARHFPVRFLLPCDTGTSTSHYPSIPVTAQAYTHRPQIASDIRRRHPSARELLKMGTSEAALHDETIVHKPIPQHGVTSPKFKSPKHVETGCEDQIQKKGDISVVKHLLHRDKATSQFSDNVKEKMSSLLKAIRQEQDMAENDLERKEEQQKFLGEGRYRSRGGNSRFDKVDQNLSQSRLAPIVQKPLARYRSEPTITDFGEKKKQCIPDIVMETCDTLTSKPHANNHETVKNHGGIDNLNKDSRSGHTKTDANKILLNNRSIDSNELLTSSTDRKKIIKPTVKRSTFNVRDALNFSDTKGHTSSKSNSDLSLDMFHEVNTCIQNDKHVNRHLLDCQESITHGHVHKAHGCSPVKSDSQLNTRHKTDTKLDGRRKSSSSVEQCQHVTKQDISPNTFDHERNSQNLVANAGGNEEIGKHSYIKPLKTGTEHVGYSGNTKQLSASHHVKENELEKIPTRKRPLVEISDDEEYIDLLSPLVSKFGGKKPRQEIRSPPLTVSELVTDLPSSNTYHFPSSCETMSKGSDRTLNDKCPTKNRYSNLVQKFSRRNYANSELSEMHSEDTSGTRYGKMNRQYSDVEVQNEQHNLSPDSEMSGKKYSPGSINKLELPSHIRSIHCDEFQNDSSKDNATRSLSNGKAGQEKRLINDLVRTPRNTGRFCNLSTSPTPIPKVARPSHPGKSYKVFDSPEIIYKHKNDRESFEDVQCNKSNIPAGERMHKDEMGDIPRNKSLANRFTMQDGKVQHSNKIKSTKSKNDKFSLLGRYRNVKQLKGTSSQVALKAVRNSNRVGELNEHGSSHQKDPYEFRATPSSDLKKTVSKSFADRIETKRQKLKKKARKSLNFPTESSSDSNIEIDSDAPADYDAELHRYDNDLQHTEQVDRDRTSGLPGDHWVSFKNGDYNENRSQTANSGTKTSGGSEKSSSYTNMSKPEFGMSKIKIKQREKVVSKFDSTFTIDFQSPYREAPCKRETASKGNILQDGWTGGTHRQTKSYKAQDGADWEGDSGHQY